MGNKNDNTKDGFVILLIATVAFTYFSGWMSILLLVELFIFGFTLLMGVNSETDHVEDSDTEHAAIRFKPKPTVVGVICEVIAAGLLIASWVLGSKQHLFNAGDGYFDLAVVILSSTCLWFIVSFYFPQKVGESRRLKNLNQALLCGYRNHAMAIVAAIALFITVKQHGQLMGWLWWLLIIVLIILYFLKYCIKKVKAS